MFHIYNYYYSKNLKLTYRWIKVVHNTTNKIILNKSPTNRLTINNNPNIRTANVKINNPIQKYPNLHQVFSNVIVRILR